MGTYRYSDTPARVHTKPRCVLESRTLELEAALTEFPVLHARYRELVSEGWSLYVVSQRRGVCNNLKQYITVPVWAIDSGKGPGYWIYYLAHEMAHTDTWKDYNHGQVFMARFKSLCPIEFQHYELGYKERSATQAGITSQHAHKAVGAPKVCNLIDLL